MTKYYHLYELIDMMGAENAGKCQAMVIDHFRKINAAPGSSKNHQAWVGGYWDHVTETMNFGVLLWDMIQATGRMDFFDEADKFSLENILLVMFLHDIEKPWKYSGESGLKTKQERKEFRAALIEEYGFALTVNQENALKYVEGVRDEDYTPDERLMSPLATVCHMCDLMSARLFYDFPIRRDRWV